MKKKYVLKNKRRFIIIIAVAISIVSSTLLITTKKTEGYAEKSYNEIIVIHGDTLWDIVCDNYGNEIDIRRMVSSVKKTNGLSTSELYVGQVILLPER